MSLDKLIAMPVETDRGLDSEVAHHFGHAPAFALVKVKNGEIDSCEVIPNPMADNHQPDQLPKFVRNTGANVMLSGGMGARAVELFKSFDIEVATGVSGPVSKVVADYLNGNISGTAPCSEGGHGHGCGGHKH